MVGGVEKKFPFLGWNPIRRSSCRSGIDLRRKERGGEKVSVQATRSLETRLRSKEQ